MVAPDDCPSQAEYIKYFDEAIGVMQTADALERVAYELGVDSAAENVTTSRSAGRRACTRAAGSAWRR